jgi:hypothetical protein
LMDTITLAAQIGDPDTENRLLAPHSELRRLLKDICVGPYSDDVVEFALILRIDGQFAQWNREGCAFLRRSFKERYITIDIFVPISRWNNRTEREIREYFAANVREALSLCARRLKRDKTPIDDERLMSDYELVVIEYLK